jgi:hypothetical protein
VEYSSNSRFNRVPKRLKPSLVISIQACPNVNRIMGLPKQSNMPLNTAKTSNGTGSPDSNKSVEDGEVDPEMINAMIIEMNKASLSVCEDLKTVRGEAEKRKLEVAQQQKRIDALVEAEEKLRSEVKRLAGVEEELKKSQSEVKRLAGVEEELEKTKVRAEYSENMVKSWKNMLAVARGNIKKGEIILSRQ